MSVDVTEDGGGMNLEAEPETPAPPAETPPVTDAAPPVVQEPPKAEDADDDDGVPDEQKMVPLAALKEARSHLKTLKAQQADYETLRQRAERASQLEAWVEQAKPIIEAVRTRPDLLKAAQGPPPEDPIAAKITDEEAALYARDVQLYTAEGKLDVAAGRRALTREYKIAHEAAREATKEAVAPLQQASSSREAQVQAARVASLKDKQGRTVPQDLVNRLFSQIPPELAADPNVASVLYFAAKGMAAHNEEAGIVAPPPPVVTEAPGGRTAPAFNLSDLDRRMARTLGRTTADYQKSAGKFKPGLPNSLED